MAHLERERIFEVWEYPIEKDVFFMPADLQSTRNLNKRIFPKRKDRVEVNLMLTGMRYGVGCLVSLLWVGMAYAADLGPPTQTLPNMTFQVLANGTNPKEELKLLPLAELKGKPSAILYWKLNDSKAETELQAFQALAQLPNYKGKVQFVSAVKASSPSEVQAAVQRARALRLQIPVLMDTNQLAPYLEAWFEFPRYGLVDKDLKLRVWHCAQLSETVGPATTFLQAIQMAAAGKPLITMRGIAKKNNTYELVGKPLPNVGLNDVHDKDTTVSKYLTGKPIVLGFWSVTCPHCRQVIPAVAQYWSLRKGNLDMLAITRAPSEMLRKMIRELYQEKKLEWPVGYAPENSTLSFFNIVKVPTVILADKKGIIRYVWIQPDAAWIGRALENAILHLNLF